MESNKKLSPIVTKLFLKGRKLSISLVFISQSYSEAPKTIRINATQYFIIRELNKVFCRRQGMLTQGPAPDPKCKLNISSFLTLPYLLDCLICTRNSVSIVLLL